MLFIACKESRGWNITVLFLTFTDESVRGDNDDHAVGDNATDDDDPDFDEDFIVFFLRWIHPGFPGTK